MSLEHTRNIRRKRSFDRTRLAAQCEENCQTALLSQLLDRAKRMKFISNISRYRYEIYAVIKDRPSRFSDEETARNSA